MFLSDGNVDWGYKCEQKNKVYKITQLVVWKKIK